MRTGEHARFEVMMRVLIGPLSRCPPLRRLSTMPPPSVPARRAPQHLARQVLHAQRREASRTCCRPVTARLTFHDSRTITSVVPPLQVAHCWVLLSLPSADSSLNAPPWQS